MRDGCTDDSTDEIVRDGSTDECMGDGNTDEIVRDDGTDECVRDGPVDDGSIAGWFGSMVHSGKGFLFENKKSIYFIFLLSRWKQTHV